MIAMPGIDTDLIDLTDYNSKLTRTNEIKASLAIFYIPN